MLCYWALSCWAVVDDFRMHVPNKFHTFVHFLYPLNFSPDNNNNINEMVMNSNANWHKKKKNSIGKLSLFLYALIFFVSIIKTSGKINGKEKSHCVTCRLCVFVSLNINHSNRWIHTYKFRVSNPMGKEFCEFTWFHWKSWVHLTSMIRIFSFYKKVWFNRKFRHKTYEWNWKGKTNHQQL